jgi:hypothetical protein
VILAPPGVQSLDVVGPAEVFWEAARRLGDPSAYEIQIMGTTAGAVCGTGSLRFLADRTIYDPDEPIDTLLVGGDPSFDEVDPAVPRGSPGARRRYGATARYAPAYSFSPRPDCSTAAVSPRIGNVPTSCATTSPISWSTTTRFSSATVRCARRPA